MGNSEHEVVVGELGEEHRVREAPHDEMTTPSPMVPATRTRDQVQQPASPIEIPLPSASGSTAREAMRERSARACVHPVGTVGV
jgi:hypothetical protein